MRNYANLRLNTSFLCLQIMHFARKMVHLKAILQLLSLPQGIKQLLFLCEAYEVGFCAKPTK